MQQINISEIFYSIQGESTYAGFPCVFIRLSGCNLRCNYCDADYTWEVNDTLSIDAVLEKINQYPTDLVEVTGGEPLFQDNCPALLSALLSHGKRVLLETNGSLSIGKLPQEVTPILDVKCPDSGSSDSFNSENIHHIRHRLEKKSASCELKFVLSSKNDYLWAVQFIRRHQLSMLLPILFSPVRDRVSPQSLAQWIMDDGLPVRLQLQLHSIIWPGFSRGV